MDLDAKYDKLTKQLKSQRSYSSPPVDREREEIRLREAFVGGFSDLQQSEILKRAANCIRTPEGFHSLRAPTGASNHVFVLFDCPESMNKWVQTVTLPGELYAKPNRPPRSPEAKARAKMVWEGCRKLVNAGVSNEQIIASRGLFWVKGGDGTAKKVGRIVDDAIQWEADAPFSA